jgi:hypothetical protein
MFWGSFSYDKKGPMHIWKVETAAKRRAADKELENLNAIREPECKTQWELNTAMRCMNITRQPAGRRPEWKFTEERGKLV